MQKNIFSPTISLLCYLSINLRGILNLDKARAITSVTSSNRDIKSNNKREVHATYFCE